MDSTKSNNMNLENVNYSKKKFSVGDIVIITGRGGTYHIYANPYWSKEYNQWIYPYDYGLCGTSYGFGLEYNMKSVKN
jgi:hypothetical protein